jgi:5-methylcytosine-specific restriction enzyme A
MPSAPAFPCPVSTCPERQPCPVHGAALARRPASHAWYRYARWCNRQYGLRTHVRALNPFCVECLREGRYTAAVDVHHIVPHRGDPSRFWDPTNLEGLCKMHHSRKTGQGQ